MGNKPLVADIFHLEIIVTAGTVFFGGSNVKEAWISLTNHRHGHHHHLLFHALVHGHAYPDRRGHRDHLFGAYLLDRLGLLGPWLVVL